MRMYGAWSMEHYIAVRNKVFWLRYASVHARAYAVTES